jgi:hypothetical protein
MVPRPRYGNKIRNVRSDMHLTPRPSKLFLVLVPFLASLLATGAMAQAKKTATRASEFDAFGGFSYVDSNYQAPLGNYGVTLGGDYTQFVPRYHGLITPSLQVRGTIAPGPTVDEKTIEGGLRLASTYKRLHPYADLLFGYGVITFNHPSLRSDGTYYSHDSTFIYIAGGGLTFDTMTNFSLMADYQYQYWDLGEHPPNRFYPYAATIGVVYHIPFKAYKTR